MNRLVAFVTAMLISGCVTPLPPPKYQGTAAVTTQKTAEVSVVNGSVSVIRVGTLLPVGKIYVPAGGGKDNDVDTQPYFKMHRDFASNFCTELGKTGDIPNRKIDARTYGGRRDGQGYRGPDQR